jgi:putative transposase
MLRSVEKRFGDRLPDTAVQWLTDNGSAYTAHETRRFARELNLEPCTTAVSSPQRHGRTVREDDERRLYRVHAKPDENSPAKPQPFITMKTTRTARDITQGIPAAADIVNLRYKSCRRWRVKIT